MRHIVAGAVILAATLINAEGHPLLAQVTGEDTTSRAMLCARAASNLKDGVQAQPHYEALADVATCPSEGSATLVEAWRKTPTDTAALRLLGEITPRIRDRDLFRTVLSTFLDRGQPRAVRLAALEALVGYYQPGLAVRYTEPAHPVRSGSAYVMLGQGEPPVVVTGRTSLTSSVRQEILQALATVGSGDHDERVSLIAEYMRNRLSSIQ